MKKIFSFGAMLAVLAVAPALNAASITYTLTQDGCSGGCGASPFGTITLTDQGSGSTATVLVTETLAAGERFAGTGAGQALEFNVTGSNITITNITANFVVGPAPATASTFGTFLYSVSCGTCVGGQAGNPAGPLSFTVGSSSGGITISNFIANSGGYFFSSDIVGASGNPPPTGNVAAIGNTSSVPEPISSALVGGGLLSLFLLRRRASK